MPKRAKPVQPVAPTPPPPPVEVPQIKTLVDLPVIYDTLKIVECSINTDTGPITVEDMKEILGWEDEKEYQQRKVAEVPSSKPEHWLYGEEYHCKNTKGVKVRTTRNANNRPFDQSWCDSLIHTVLHGQWAGPFTIPGETVNGETIRISKYGRVLSGQHQGTALILADEWLKKARTQLGAACDEKYPVWKGMDEPFLESVVITGLSEDPRVLMTIDYCKPRTAADVFYTSEVFKDAAPPERKELCRVLAAATDLLWIRTDTKGYKTHPEIVGFLDRHKTLMECVIHLFKENSAKGADGGRKISKLRLSPGHCAALFYIMGSSGEKTDSDVYRNESPPSEKNLDWSYFDKAKEFWSKLARSEYFLPVRIALNQLVESKPSDDDNQGLGGRQAEKLAILAKAWEMFKDEPDSAGSPFSEDDLAEGGALCLSYSDLDDKGNQLPDGQIKLIDVADFYGIDCPEVIQKGTDRQAPPMPPPPTKEEIEKAAQEQLAKREENKKKILALRSKGPTAKQVQADQTRKAQEADAAMSK